MPVRSAIPRLPITHAAMVLRSTVEKVNETCSRGAFPCAPRTRPGSRRHFEERDIIALRINDSLLAIEPGDQASAAKKDAGRIACDCKDHFEWAEANGLRLEQVRFPANLKFYRGIPVYLADDGSLIGADGNPPPSDRELMSRNTLVVNVGLHLEDIRAVFAELVSNGSLAEYA